MTISKRVCANERMDKLPALLLTRLFWIVLFGMFTASWSLALDPARSLRQLYHTAWGADHGVDSTVVALAQTSDGYLWAGTTTGLLRYDGVAFRPFRPEHGQLSASFVSALMASKDGDLWVGFSSGGVSLVKNGSVTNYSAADGLPVGLIRAFVQDKAGVVWVGGIGGFARLENNRWRKVRAEWNFPGNAASALFVDREGLLWVGCPGVDRKNSIRS